MSNLESEFKRHITAGNIDTLKACACVALEYWNSHPAALLSAAIQAKKAEILLFLLQEKFPVGDAEAEAAFEIFSRSESDSILQQGIQTLLEIHPASQIISKTIALACKDGHWLLLHSIFKWIVPESNVGREIVIREIFDIVKHDMSICPHLTDLVNVDDLNQLLKCAVLCRNDKIIDAILGFYPTAEKLRLLDIKSAIEMVTDNQQYVVLKLMPYVDDGALDIGHLNSVVNRLCQYNILVSDTLVELIRKTNLCDNLDLRLVLECDRDDILRAFVTASVDIASYVEKVQARSGDKILGTQCQKYLCTFKRNQDLREGFGQLIAAVQKIMQTLEV